MRLQTIAVLATAAAVALMVTACEKPIHETVPVNSVEITGVPAALAIGTEAQLTARPLDNQGNPLARSVAWASSNSSVATINQSGVVRGIAGGTAIISAASEGKTGTANILVQFPSPTIVALNPSTALQQSGAFTLIVTGTNFLPTSIVKWGGADRPTTFVNATTLQAAIPESDIALPRFVEVTVFTPPPGGGTTISRLFAVRLNATGPQIVSGLDHTCAIVSSTTYCWGGNIGSELGDGSTVDRLIPVALNGNIPLLLLSSFNRTTCGLDVIGAAYCWGANPAGARGTGGGAAGVNPNAVADNRQYKAISVGNMHACALDLSGAAWCWGDDGSGQLGDGGTTDSNRPVRVSGGLTFVAISTGGLFSCGLTAAGVAHCWGENGSGQLGDGTTVDRGTPAAVSTPPLASLTSGNAHTCGRTAAGVVYCWGAGGSGQLGRGSLAVSNVPVIATGVVSASLEAGTDHVCSATTAGAVSCWGDNAFAQLGVGNTTDRTTALQLTGLPAVREIAAGVRHTCAMTVNNEIYCWGSKGRGQLGDGTTGLRMGPAQVTGSSPAFSQVSVGDWFSCGLRVNGTISCWGLGSGGQLGSGTNTNALVPANIASSNSYTAVTVGGGHACGIVSGTNAALCWGENPQGQLGNGNTVTALVPVPVLGNHQFRMLSAGNDHTCGITTTQQLLCWGLNGVGQLGLGNNVNTSTPSVVAPPQGATYNHVSASNVHTCASATDGNAYCWGGNGSGQLGDGTTTARNTPTPVRALTGMVEVAAGGTHSCARNAAGNAFCWGGNGNGQLGLGVAGNQLTPTQVVGNLIFRSITAFGTVTCGLTMANQGYCWGANLVGQLGVNSTTASSNAPSQLAGGLSWASIESSGDHTCGVTSAGLAYCWGLQAVGELGIGLSGVEMVPKRVPPSAFSAGRARVPRLILR
jgi:alpha-tubulin suppressor-like RCC1 family protein